VAAEPLAAQVLQHLFVGDAVKRVALDHLVEPARRLVAVDLAPARAPWTSSGRVPCGSAATHSPSHCRGHPASGRRPTRVERVVPLRGPASYTRTVPLDRSIPSAGG